MSLHDIVTKGSIDRSVTVAIIDSADGTPETGVVFNTAGIALWYRREGAAKTDITEATLAALTTAHADGGFLHIADGIYRLDLPDAAFATGANSVDFGGTVTGMVVIGGRVRLVDNNQEVADITAIQVADALLDRDMATGTDSGSPSVRTVRQALRVLRNKVTSAGGTMTVMKEHDSTSSWTAALTTDPAADPIVTIDPA